MIEWYWAAITLGVGNVMGFVTAYLVRFIKRGTALEDWTRTNEVLGNNWTLTAGTGTHPGGVSYVLPEQFSPARKFDRDRKEGVEMRSASRGEEPRKR